MGRALPEFGLCLLRLPAKGEFLFKRFGASSAFLDWRGLRSASMLREGSCFRKHWAGLFGARLYSLRSPNWHSRFRPMQVTTLSRCGAVGPAVRRAWTHALVAQTGDDKLLTMSISSRIRS